MGCFVVAEFLLTIASRGPSAIAEPLVLLERELTQTHKVADVTYHHTHASVVGVGNSCCGFTSIHGHRSTKLL